MPVIILAHFYNFIARVLIKSGLKKYGILGGRRSQIALKLNKKAHIIMRAVSVDTVSYTTQIKDEEIIMKAIDAKKAYDFICEDDKKAPPDQRTVFKCKYLDPYTAARLGDQIYNVSGTGSKRKERLLTGTQQFEILKSCLVGWENMEHPNNEGEKFTFDRDRIEDMIAAIPPKYRAEIADFIRGESELEEGEGNG